MVQLCYGEQETVYVAVDAPTVLAGMLEQAGAVLQFDDWLLSQPI